MNEDARLVATPSQTVGPFFHFALPGHAPGRMSDRSRGGEQIRLTIRVTDADGQPVTDALVELWQMRAALDGADFVRMQTGEDGDCEFELVRPDRIPNSAGRPQAAHINVCLFARGLLRQLHTRIYFAGDPGLADDAALALVPQHRRGTLVATLDAARPGRWLFEVRLQGTQETVFFDP